MAKGEDWQLRTCKSSGSGEKQELAGLTSFGSSGAGINVFNIENPESLVNVQADVFTDVTFPRGNGANDTVQTAIRPHQVVLDPTGDFIVMPDLGSDLVRVFKVDNTTLKYTQLTDKNINSAAGSGPRHAAFLAVPGGKTFLYVIHEFANTIVGYETIYGTNQTVSFNEIFTVTTHGEQPGNSTIPAGTFAAEILLSVCTNFVYFNKRETRRKETDLLTTLPARPTIPCRLVPARGPTYGPQL
jgi:6-phosphogluconolactonase (cycloisomerase 2 family)